MNHKDPSYPSRVWLLQFRFPPPSCTSRHPVYGPKLPKYEGVVADHGCYGAALAACHSARQWNLVYDLLFEMRSNGVITPATMRPYHKSMWTQVSKPKARPLLRVPMATQLIVNLMQAKRELGFFKEKPTPRHKLRERTSRGALYKMRAGKSKTKA